MSSSAGPRDGDADLLRELKYGAELSSTRLGRVEERLDGVTSLLERIVELLERYESDHLDTEAGHLAILERMAGLLEGRAGPACGGPAECGEALLDDEDQEMARHVRG